MAVQSDTVLQNCTRTLLPLNEDLKTELPNSRIEFSYKKLRQSDLSKVKKCLVEIVNAGSPISTRHWELITARDGKLVIDSEEKTLSYDLLDIPETFLEYISLQNHIDLKSTSSKHN